jgi:hypothetical protein
MLKVPFAVTNVIKRLHQLRIGAVEAISLPAGDEKWYQLQHSES